MTAPVLDPADDTALDPAVAARPGPDDEEARVAALHAFGVLDQPRQADLDAAARLAAYVCGTPTAVVNLIDSARQWQAAAYGVEPGEVAREDSMCQHTVLGTDVVYTPDARADAVFEGSPFVTGQLAAVRLYASAPLLTRDGHAIGTVCAYDGGGLARAASRDPLTGLADRRAIESAIGKAIARAERGLGTPSLVVVDLDGFKQVNDELGHAAGDAVLRDVADPTG